jgi:hypothetical protein
VVFFGPGADRAPTVDEVVRWAHTVALETVTGRVSRHVTEEGW